MSPSDIVNRAGGRSSRRAKRALHVPPMLPTLENRLPLTAPMDEDQIARIDDASMSILEDVGVVFRDPVALDDWRKAGANVVGDLVKFDRAHIRSLISSIPQTITIHA
ncbi:trimethylamine methyltransferase family protein, partial [Candidatus Puniceispirillum sp.]|uniref:trimethylamine methyltransferase family protein n=1 Tax=Candidatus Puniceispirillum sp. TaxID=2026719 RepID=UPI001EB4E06B|nr:trimethylamine methyltransferase [Candidatus Puniceispirillum sp.]